MNATFYWHNWQKTFHLKHCKKHSILLTFVAFCSVATAFADKFVRFRLFKKLILKFSDGVGTLLILNVFNERNFCRRVSRSILSGVCVLLSCVCPRDDENKLLELPLLLLLLKLSKGCDVLVLILFDLYAYVVWGERRNELMCH